MSALSDYIVEAKRQRKILEHSRWESRWSQFLCQSESIPPIRKWHQLAVAEAIQQGTLTVVGPIMETTTEAIEHVLSYRESIKAGGGHGISMVRDQSLREYDIAMSRLQLYVPGDIISKSADIPQEIRANDFRLFPQGPLGDRDITELVIELNTQKNTGKSINQIAREYTRETKGSDNRAKSMLSTIRRLKREGRVNY